MSLFSNPKNLSKDLAKTEGIYIAVDYNPVSVRVIENILKDINKYLSTQNKKSVVNDTDYKYHTTISYFRFPKSFSLKEKERILGYKIANTRSLTQPEGKKPKIVTPITITGFGFFDTPDGRNFHIEVKSSFLQSEFKKAVKFGIEYSFPEYTPHISICNNVPKDFEVPKEIQNKYKGSVLFTNDQYVETLQGI